MNSSRTPLDQLFSWTLTQEHIDLLAFILIKAESIFDLVDSKCLIAERTACLVTDLREQTSRAGAADPYPDRPMFRRFEEAGEVGKSRNDDEERAA